MAVTFTVQADSEAEALQELDRLCALLGAVPKGQPMLLPGRGRWMARAAAPVTVRSHHPRPVRTA